MLVSCGNRKLQRQMEVFTGSEITIPNGMRQMVGGRDSILMNPTDGSARLVIWIDPKECSSCRIGQMFRYNDVVDYRNEVGDGFVPVFVFSPPEDKIEEVMVKLKYGEFAYPVLLDEGHLFDTVNPHIPDDSRFHTFLLDKNGKVVLVGDPVYNPDLWKLYKKAIRQLIDNGGTLPE